MPSQPKVVIVRDRLSAGGGIHNYYHSIKEHLAANVRWVDVGKPQGFYGDLQGIEKLLARSTLIRLIVEWASLVWAILIHRPALVHINPGLDALKQRALKRDAINLLIARCFFRKTLVFWRGWEAKWIGKPEFPGGNEGKLARIYRSADAHIVLSSEFRRDLRAWGFNSPIHLETTVGSNTPIGDEAPSQSEKTISKNILFLSRIERMKGVFELYEAFLILKRTDPTYSLTFAGDGPDLEALREQCNGEPNVHFAGYVSGEAKTKCYRDAGVFCFLSAYGEGMPNAVLEALGMGLPVVSSTAGGLKDIISHGKEGFIVPREPNRPDNLLFCPETTAQHIRTLTESPELYQKMVEHNLSYAKAKFTPTVCASRLLRIYRAIIDGDRTTSFDH